MVDLRKGIIALAVLALFAGLASAQVGATGQSQLTCATNVTVTPQLRGEGYTEQTGDITITCTGGVAPAQGTQIPTTNIVVYYNTTVTSRLLPTTSGSTSGQTSGNTSEALLLIDEPGSGLPGYGPTLPQALCTTPLTGCVATVGNMAGVTNGTAVDGYPIVSSTGVVTTSTTPAKNVYQGVVSGNSVTFFGVPVMPPTTTGSRVYRITNVRVNAQPLAGGSSAGAGSAVTASISTNSGTSLGISNSYPNVGYVLNGLSASAGSSTQNQCSSQTKTAVSTVTFTEQFATAFKTRVNAQSDTLYAGQINNPTQNIPGAIYNSESNFVFPVGANQIAGLADFGTRLKATFTNIPDGATVWVSTSNVNNAALPVLKPPVGASGIIGGSAGNANAAGGAAYVGFAQLINGELTSAGNAGTAGFFPAVTGTDNGPGSTGIVPIAAVSIVGGTGSAVWEVVNSNPNTIESLKFQVYVSYSANVASNKPLPGDSFVSLSYAPTATSGVASASLPIPRFAGDSSAARKVLTIQICRTVLLYPYITNLAGFDTGLTVANTSADGPSFSTANQTGNCKLNYFGGATILATTPQAQGDTGNIPAGAVWANMLSIINPNFQGYMFAVCNFQYAHGFAFISDVGSQKLAMGYLAVVLNDPGTGARSNTNTTGAENGGQ